MRRHMVAIAGLVGLVLLTGCGSAPSTPADERQQWQTGDSGAISSHEAAPVDTGAPGDDNGASDGVTGAETGHANVPDVADVPEYGGYLAEDAGLFEAPSWFVDVDYDAAIRTLTVSGMVAGGGSGKVVANGVELAVVSRVDATASAGASRSFVTYRGVVEDADTLTMSFGGVSATVDVAEAYAHADGAVSRVTLADGDVSSAEAEAIARAVAVRLRGGTALARVQERVAGEAYDIDVTPGWESGSLVLRGSVTNKGDAEAAGVEVGLLVFGDVTKASSGDGAAVGASRLVTSVVAPVGDVAAGETVEFSCACDVSLTDVADVRGITVKVADVLGF